MNVYRFNAIRRSLWALSISTVALAASHTAVSAQYLSMAPEYNASAPFDRDLRDGGGSYQREQFEDSQTSMNLRRQVVNYPTREAPGTIIIDTANTYLYLVTGNGQALRYGIGVGREGFAWSGVESISRMAQWPDWHPPAEMIGRQPYLPRFMAGGPGNPLGARALYLGSTEYRIHGTNDPTTIGKRVSSGCIRLTNEDVSDLYGRIRQGAKVVVLPASGRSLPTAQRRTPAKPVAVSANVRPVAMSSNGSFGIN